MSHPRIGMLGAGGLASKQIYPNLAPAGLKLAAVCDLDLAKAQAKTGLYGGVAYTDLDRMLAEAELDGVILCVGPEFHCSGALRVLQAGLPVYTEKPPAVCAEDLWPVVELARATGLLAMTAMKKRYADVYHRAKQAVDAGELGTLHHLMMHRVSHIHWRNDSPRSDHLLDYGVHNIDLCAFLLGAVDTVSADAIGKSVYQITLRYASGALGSISFVERPGGPPAESLELTGSEGWMSIHNQSEYRLQRGSAIEIRDPNFSTAGGDGGAVTGHRSELEAFARALTDGARPASHIEESYRTMCIYDAVVRAVASGGSERVRDRLRDSVPA